MIDPLFDPEKLVLRPPHGGNSRRPGEIEARRARIYLGVGPGDRPADASKYGSPRSSRWMIARFGRGNPGTFEATLDR
jgi:hypothetical protein